MLVGLNSTTRHLEELNKHVQVRKSSKTQSDGDGSSNTTHPRPDGGLATRHISAIFVSRSSQPSILHAHLPLLIASASQAHPSLPTTRLLQLPKGSEARLAAALGLPRVNFITLLDAAPHSKPLIDYVRENVAELDVRWLEEAQSEQYLPVKINAVETFAPVTKKVKA
jgi:hypothetical protein